jgi:hypothetical protein
MRKCRLSSLIKVAAFSSFLWSLFSSAEESASNSDRLRGNNPKSETVGRIKAGYGTDEWHVGMSISEFGNEWERHLKGPKEGGHLINRKLGIAAIFYEDRVISTFAVLSGEDEEFL